MHRELLIQCLPAAVALALSFVALRLLVRWSGAQLNIRRLRQLHHCQEGGVQSLAFVLTLPVFVMVMLFIVQVSQLMIGLVTVHYAAFAAARAGSVWIPAQVGTAEPQNRWNPYVLENPFGAEYQPLRMIPEQSTLLAQADASSLSHKYSRIRTAAVMGCAPVSPSRDVRFAAADMTQASTNALRAAQMIYSTMAPSSQSNPRINRRLENKIRYADRNTVVFVEWQDSLPGPNSLEGPTYNPVNHPNAGDFQHLGIDSQEAYERYGYKPYEVGWQDPVTVYVVHRYALFPGPGRLVANLLIRPLALPERVRQRVPADWQSSYVAESETYSILIPAAATLPAEGIKSTRPYVHSTY